VLTLAELGAYIREHHHRDLFRLETLPAYSAASDGGDYERFLRGEPGPTVDKTAWIDTLRTATAAGRAWRRLRLIHTPITDYERYACTWGYPDNVAAGEDVRVLVVPTGDRTHERVGDFFVLDDRHVIRSVYDAHGALQGAQIQHGTEADTLIGVRDLLWERAQPFTQWWAGTHTGTAQVA